MKKVGELYNIPIVEGDPNLLTNKQLLYKDGVLSKRDSTGDIKNLGNAGSESTMEYLDISGLDKSYVGFKILLKMAYQVKGVGANISIAPFGLLALEGEDIAANITIAIAIDFNTSMVMRSQFIDYYTVLSKVYSKEQLDSIPRITKEQFYNLEA